MVFQPDKFCHLMFRFHMLHQADCKLLDNKIRLVKVCYLPAVFTSLVSLAMTV